MSMNKRRNLNRLLSNWKKKSMRLVNWEKNPIKKTVPYYEQVQQLALPGPSGEQPSEIVSNMNKGFTSGELAILQKYKLPLPSNVLMETLKDGDTVSKVLDKTGEINKELGHAKGHLSTTKTAQKKIKIK